MSRSRLCLSWPFPSREMHPKTVKVAQNQRFRLALTLFFRPDVARARQMVLEELVLENFDPDCPNSWEKAINDVKVGPDKTLVVADTVVSW